MATKKRTKKKSRRKFPALKRKTFDGRDWDGMKKHHEAMLKLGHDIAAIHGSGSTTIVSGAHGNPAWSQYRKEHL